MKKNIVYIGNALSNRGKTQTAIETLSANLRQFANVKIASDKENKVLRLLDMMRLVITEVRRVDYVLIDTYSTVNFYYALVVSQLCRIVNVPYINILHGGALENRLRSNPRLSRLVFSNSYKLVAPSHFLKNTFISFGYDNVVYIPNTIKLKEYEFVDRNIDKVKLLWVRSFSSIYNPQMAIYLLKALKDEGYNATLTMIGPEVDGSLSDVKSLAQQFKLEVNFTGLLPRKKWIECSRKYNVFINTTYVDNMPVGVVEAMALGLPVISTNVGGIPFLIEDDINGILVPPNDVDAMKTAVLRIKTDTTFRSNLIKQARLKAQKYDWDIVRHKWSELFAEQS